MTLLVVAGLLLLALAARPRVVTPPPPPPGTPAGGGAPAVATPGAPQAAPDPVDGMILDSDPFVFDTVPNPGQLDTPTGRAWRDLFLLQIWKTASRMMPTDRDIAAAQGALAYNTLAPLDPKWQGIDPSLMDGTLSTVENYVNLIPIVGQLFSALLRGEQAIVDSALASSNAGWAKVVNAGKSPAPPDEFLKVAGTQFVLGSVHNPGALPTVSEGGAQPDQELAMPGIYTAAGVDPQTGNAPWALPWDVGGRKVYPRSELFTLMGVIGVAKGAGPWVLPWNLIGVGQGTRARCRIAAGILRVIDLMACKKIPMPLDPVANGVYPGLYCWEDKNTTILGTTVGVVSGSIFPRMAHQGNPAASTTGVVGTAAGAQGAQATAARKGDASSSASSPGVSRVLTHVDPSALARWRTGA